MRIFAWVATVCICIYIYYCVCICKSFLGSPRVICLPARLPNTWTSKKSPESGVRCPNCFDAFFQNSIYCCSYLSILKYYRKPWEREKNTSTVESGVQLVLMFFSFQNSIFCWWYFRGIRNLPLYWGQVFSTIFISQSQIVLASKTLDTYRQSKTMKRHVTKCFHLGDDKLL